MSTSASEEEMFMYTPYDKWNASAESIITQKIAKITKSESGFKFQPYNPNLTISQLEMREMHLKNFREKAQNWELVQKKCRFPRMIQTRSLLRDELEILRINMSMHEKVIALRESQLQEEARGREGKRRKLLKLMSEAPLLQKFVSSKVKDLLSEIDASELAKTDKVTWKFLKRGPSIRKEAINAKKFVLHVQTLYLPVLDLLSDSRFFDSQPLKITCPNCRFFITTHVKKISTLRTKLTSLLLALVRFCLVPNDFFLFSHSVHLCPLCKIYLGFSPAFNIRMRKKNRTNQKFENRTNLITAAKNFALQEAAIENSETNLKKLKLLTTHMNNQLDSLHNSSGKIEVVLEQVCSMQR